MNPLHRIIDANANRAREALRVMEDAARFGLDDPRLTEDLKQLRHGLRAALDQRALDPVVLLAARDVEGDQGRTIKTAPEMSRSGLRDVAAAAGARLGESLRSLEESAKALGADAAPLETLRYQAYTLQQRLMLAMPTGRCPQWRLCVLITESLCRRPWPQIALGAIEGGADCLQLREKQLPDRELLARARRLVDIARGPTARHGRAVSIIINDRPDIALACGADGVHLGQSDMPIASAREIVGLRLLIGVSTSNLDEARAAVQSGADYCGVGPMFPTTTKHKPAISGPNYLKSYLEDPILSQRPHLAIGGITPDTVGELLAVGCRGVAVSAAVCSAAEPADMCRQIVGRFEE